jgi:protein-disulfide isomerase
MRLISVLLVTLVACSTPAEAPPAKPDAPANATAPSAPAADAGKGGGAAIATVNGQPITMADLEAKHAGALTKARQEMYDAQRNALEEMILEQLLEAEATKRSMSKDDLLKAEVEAKVGPPDPAEVQKMYDENKARIGPATLEEVRPRIEEFLRNKGMSERMRAFAGELKKAAGVKIALEIPRVKVEVPATAARFGSPTAPVQIIEFSDFQCPYCGDAARTVKQLKEKFGDKVSIVFRHFPLEIHPAAPKASEAALCANDVGKFWEYHDKAFANQSALSPADLTKYATELGLDAAAFDACLSSGKHAADVKADMEYGTKLGIEGTPAFYVNGRFLGGSLPVEAFSELIQEELGGI